MEHFRLNYERTINPEDSKVHFETYIYIPEIPTPFGFFSTSF
jgi:hypothetical protein